jgi:hypothetical protein
MAASAEPRQHLSQLGIRTETRGSEQVSLRWPIAPCESDCAAGGRSQAGRANHPLHELMDKKSAVTPA